MAAGALGGLAAAAVATPALGGDPLAAGTEVRRAVLEEVSPFAEWLVGGTKIAFGRSEVRRIGDFAHVRAVVGRADGGSLDLDDAPGTGGAARPATISGVLRHRDGRWMLLDAAIERADTIDPDAAYRRWRLPAGLLPPDCAHRQNWGCGEVAR